MNSTPGLLVTAETALVGILQTVTNGKVWKKAGEICANLLSSLVWEFLNLCFPLSKTTR